MAAGSAQIYGKEQEGNEIISRWLRKGTTPAGDTQKCGRCNGIKNLSGSSSEWDTVAKTKVNLI